MRILLTHHFPLRQSPVGWLVWHWGEALQAAGHEVQLLIADRTHHFGESMTVERVVCGDDPNADLRFDLPRFSSPPDSGPTFASLSGGELAEYRERLRRRLDAIVLRFDPHVIHAQHVWLLGQLALETGVPYVLNGWQEELADSRVGELLPSLAEQAAENAGRILVPDEVTREKVDARFAPPNERLVLIPQEALLVEPTVVAGGSEASAAHLQGVYEAVLKERFG